MKKKIFFASVALIVAVSTAIGMQSIDCDKPSSLKLANIEALTKDESSKKEKCYNSITTKEGSQVLYCGTCTYLPGTDDIISGTGLCPK